MKNAIIKNGAKLLKALANEKRLEILFLLMNQEFKVGEIEKLVALSQSALSQHLAILREAKIVKCRRVAQAVYYSFCSEEAKKLVELLYNLYAKHYK